MILSNAYREHIQLTLSSEPPVSSSLCIAISVADQRLQLLRRCLGMQCALPCAWLDRGLLSRVSTFSSTSQPFHGGRHIHSQ